MVFLIMNSIDILEELRMLMMIMTHLSRDFMKMQSIGDDIKLKGMMKRKVIGTMGTTQTRNQFCCSRKNDMMRKIDVRLAHRRNLCSGKKDQVAQLKFVTTMI